MAGDFISQRERYSSRRLTRLSTEIAANTKDLDLDGLTIICAGSYARGEASKYSDIDLFFAYRQKPSSSRPKTNELRLFGRLIDLNDRLGFPPFSRDALFLKTHNAQDMRTHLGAPRDDESNYFTMRMLTLLESKCVHGPEAYNEIVSRFIEWYFEDSAKHPDDFEPWALINDIQRYWQTILLNYVNANYTNRLKDPELDEDPDVERRVRKFKLKFSRATTCFASIAAITSQRQPHTPETLRRIVELTPRARLALAAAQMPEIAELVDAALALYEWFLNQTSQPKDKLRAHFIDGVDRTGTRRRAKEYGDSLYNILVQIGKLRDKSKRDLIRYLVV